MSEIRAEESKIMALLKVLRAGQVTLPAELRQKLQLAEGDYLEAEVVENGVLLRPIKVIGRDEAWRKIRQGQAGVRYVGPEPRPSPEEEEEAIYEIVREFRARNG